MSTFLKICSCKHYVKRNEILNHVVPPTWSGGMNYNEMTLFNPHTMLLDQTNKHLSVQSHPGGTKAPLFNSIPTLMLQTCVFYLSQSPCWCWWYKPLLFNLVKPHAYSDTYCSTYIYAFHLNPHAALLVVQTNTFLFNLHAVGTNDHYHRIQLIIQDHGYGTNLCFLFQSSVPRWWYNFTQWRMQKIFMGGAFGSGSYGGHLYLFCAVCDVTI